MCDFECAFLKCHDTDQHIFLKIGILFARQMCLGSDFFEAWKTDNSAQIDVKASCMEKSISFGDGDNRLMDTRNKQPWSYPD